LPFFYLLKSQKIIAERGKSFLMIKVNVPRLYIGGSSSRVGKSLICLALAVELRSRKLSVSICTSAPRLAESVLFQRTTGRYCRCLDETLLSQEDIIQGFYGASVGADVILFDGHGGLYDAYEAGTLWGSDASLATLTRTPVTLVLDGLQYGTSIAPLALGYLQAAEDFSIASLMVNKSCITRDGQKRDREFFDSSMSMFGLPKVTGAFPILPEGAVLPRRSISQLDNRTSLPRQFFIDIVEEIRKSIDVDSLLEIAHSAPVVSYDLEPFEPSLRRCKIAVAQDLCFSTCFQDNLELLRLHGAELIAFSPVADSTLPKNIGGIYVPGGYISSYAADLMANESIRESIRDFAANGGAIYSEGAGTAYLCDEYYVERTEEVFKGVGLIAARARTGKEENRPFRAKISSPTILGREGIGLCGLMPGDWLFEEAPAVVKAMRAIYETGEEWQEGLVAGAQVFSTLGFLHWGFSPQVAQNFVEVAQAHAPLPTYEDG
jgi:cobyrinic acid a,c-diamide synthase